MDYFKRNSCWNLNWLVYLRKNYEHNLILSTIDLLQSAKNQIQSTTEIKKQKKKPSYPWLDQEGRKDLLWFYAWFRIHGKIGPPVSFAEKIKFLAQIIQKLYAFSLQKNVPWAAVSLRAIEIRIGFTHIPRKFHPFLNGNKVHFI